MGRCKEIVIKVIPAKIANDFVKEHHYSGKVVANSQLHFGAFLDGRLHGVLQYGPSMDKRKVMSLVEGTEWNGFVELNRMAFDDYLPRNSESYCIGATLRMIRKQAPQIKWVISFADGAQCGDGTIYRASNFVLTGITPNKTILELPTGERIAALTFENNPNCPPHREGVQAPRHPRQVSHTQGLDQPRREVRRRLPTPIHLLHRSQVSQASDRSRASFFGDRPTRRRNVQGRERDTGGASRR